MQYIIDHTYLIRSEKDRERVLADIAAADLTKPLQVVCRPYKERRTLPQNSGYAVLIHELAVKLSPITGDTVRDLEKDLRDFVRYNLVPPKQHAIGAYPSTRNCDVEEMSEVIERLYAWAASEWGIELSALVPARVREG